MALVMQISWSDLQQQQQQQQLQQQQVFINIGMPR